MKERDFKYFGSIAKMLDYKQIPFGKVKTLKFTQILHEVEFKTSHCPYVPMKNTQIELSQDKRKDIMKMYPLMPLQNREYFKAILDSVLCRPTCFGNSNVSEFKCFNVERKL